MVRCVEWLLGAALLAVLFAPVAALVAGLAVMLGGAAFFPVFMPLTTAAVAAVLVWQAVRTTRRNRHRSK